MSNNYYYSKKNIKEEKSRKNNNMNIDVNIIDNKTIEDKRKTNYIKSLRNEYGTNDIFFTS